MGFFLARSFLFSHAHQRQYAQRRPFKRVIRGVRPLQCKYLTLQRAAKSLRRAGNEQTFWEDPILVGKTPFSSDRQEVVMIQKNSTVRTQGQGKSWRHALATYPSLLRPKAQIVLFLPFLLKVKGRVSGSAAILGAAKTDVVKHAVRSTATASQARFVRDGARVTCNIL